MIVFLPFTHIFRTRTAALLYLLLLLSGCTGYKNTLEKSWYHASRGEHLQALETLEKSSLADSDKNRLLYLMEKGVLQHLSEDFAGSNQTLEEADRLAEELYTVSLTDATFSFVTNDNITEYAGVDYEIAYISYLKILNYIALGELDGARVESRRIDEKLNYLSATYPDSDGIIESPFLRLVTGFIYEALGEYNDAFIAYRKSVAGYHDGVERGVSAPDLLWPRLRHSARMSGLVEDYRELNNTYGGPDDEAAGEAGPTALVVLVEYGAAPVLEEVAIIVPSGQGFPVKVAMPEFVSRSRTPPPIRVSLDGGDTFRLTMAADVDSVARASLAARRGRIMAKAIARAVAKQVAAHQANKQLGGLAGLTMQLTALITEQADLRTWDNLPAAILVSVIPAQPGARQISLQRNNDEQTFDVTIEEGRLNFFATRLF